MARRGFLDYVLGGAVGGFEGLAQKRAAEEEKKRMADAAAMDQARFLISSGFRIAPPETEDPAARSILPPLEMPSTTRPSLSPMTMPFIAPRPSAGVSRALSAALNRDFKVDATKPSLSLGLNADPLALDNRTTRMTEVLGRGQEARAAQEAIAASVNLPGGMNMRFNAPETAAQVASRTRTESDAKRSQELSQALSALTPEQLKEYGPIVRASFAGVPSNVLSSIITPREGRARRTQLIPETGQIVDLDTGEIVRVKGYVIPPDKRGDDTDKAKTAGISKIIGNAGRILETAREEERRAQTQIAALEKSRPDPNRFAGTDEFAAAEAAWQKKADDADKRLDEAQAKVGRMAPVYNMGALANDTTGFGEAFRDRPPAPPSTRSFDLFSPTANDKKFGTAFGTPAATPKPAPQAPGNTKEAALSAGAQRKINEIQSSDLTPEEKQEKVQQVNAILSREIMKARGQGR
mgnify:CR=1 FL=1